MRMAVPGRVGLDIGEPEIGRQVDYLQMAGQRRHHFLGGAVRQAAKHRVEAGPVEVVDARQFRQVEAAQMRKHGRDVFAGAPVGGQGDDLKTGVARGQADGLGPGVAAGSQNRDPWLGAHGGDLLVKRFR